MAPSSSTYRLTPTNPLSRELDSRETFSTWGVRSAGGQQHEAREPPAPAAAPRAHAPAAHQVERGGRVQHARVHAAALWQVAQQVLLLLPALGRALLGPARRKVLLRSGGAGGSVHRGGGRLSAAPALPGPRSGLALSLSSRHSISLSGGTSSSHSCSGSFLRGAAGAGAAAAGSWAASRAPRAALLEGRCPAHSHDQGGTGREHAAPQLTWRRGCTQT